MLAMEQQRLAQEIVELAQNHGRERAALLPILQAVQEKYHHISDFAMQEVANLLGIHPVEVYAVVTFYAFLGEEWKGRFIIRLCRTISCDMANKDAVARQLENELGITFGETTPDGRFTLEWANCIGMCDQGPALLVNDQVFTKVTLDKVLDILDGCRKAFGVYAVTATGGH
jgi:[NiFe] hydrogenase diaphorase moiety large subunit